jgi:hypothetical protein
MLARTYPAVHRFLKYEDPQVMAPDEPDPPEEISVEWMKVRQGLTFTGESCLSLHRTCFICSVNSI